VRLDRFVQVDRRRQHPTCRLDGVRDLVSLSQKGFYRLSHRTEAREKGGGAGDERTGENGERDECGLTDYGYTGGRQHLSE